MNKDKTLEKDPQEEGSSQDPKQEKEASTREEKVEEKNKEQAPEQVSELSDLEKAQQESAEWKDKYLRLHAEFDNFRKRNAKERVELIKTAGIDVIREMLGVVDDLDRAMKANETNEDIVAVKEGFTLIQQKMMNLMLTKGLKPMESQGKDFNTDWHEAISQIPAPSKKMRGKVVDVVEKGYLMNDHVLRYAKVVVGQ